MSFWHLASAIMGGMSDEQKGEQQEMLRLLRENTSIVTENNKLLKSIHKYHKLGFMFKILWFAIIIGLPFAVYFYFLEPYFTALGANYDLFRAGIGEIPGLKGFESFFAPENTGQ